MKLTLKGIEDESLAEMEKTHRILSALPEDRKDWKPHTKSMSLGNLAAHIVELQTWYNNAILKDSFDLASDYYAIKYDNFGQLNDLLMKQVKQNLEVMKEQSDDFWLQNFTFKKGDYVIVTLPRVAFIRSILTNHFIHHRGQLSVYLRLLDLPVPGIYGPSADEL